MFFWFFHREVAYRVILFYTSCCALGIPCIVDCLTTEDGGLLLSWPSSSDVFLNLC
ncbi:hypothetical protein ECH_0530 [Ehrlichia chaffeensis str. Arkansas]|uniref:Uncharacterized protein n=1 Tax=Ehrlichia chaffeensis (strain ATCC CRL-10679 / Arkansas) TaxID=205920 RepID=Q2GGT9_EHRCR|nr:hypothetical protein ECH_0530 [Ehrlichia chaffeensis str. Arkansas]